MVDATTEEIGPRRDVLPRVLLLLVGSGLCALVYQVAWLRLLRLVFGSSTASNAAVLAIFMGGLGFGSLILGRRADRHPNPLLFYARLELGIAAAAAFSPLLIAGVRAVYLGLGGSARLGVVPGTAVRLVLAAVVLGLPTFLMGGTLPAVARAVRKDRGRRSLGLLYGANTLGAVLGALVTTLLVLEVLGVRSTVWCASVLNGTIALVAFWLARGWVETPSAGVAGQGESGSVDARAPTPYVLAAAALVGFVFFVMELVWYRMLAPLLGGSSYTFGLILAVALLGIGAGGLLYGLGSKERRPTLASFATTCALEAAFVALPLALGDRLAVLAYELRGLSTLGFDGLVLSWSMVTAIVVLVPALVAGYQFPLLVALLGSGGRRIGRQIGLTYAWNTAGAIAGSLVGGFGIIPWLSAPGAWRFVVVALLALAVAAVLLHQRGGADGAEALPPMAVVVVGAVLVMAPGPTAFWRHSPIGVGRPLASFTDPNSLRDAVHTREREIVWEVDGIESSIGLDAGDGYGFIISGKNDGNARNDAPTQVMAGLVGAALHPHPRTGLVIGLGTGSTAGWMAQVSSMQRVDVVEIEPAVKRVAEACRSVNADVLANPDVRLIIGDGRELLLSTDERYDLIFSEPSNPYRAGVSSLFTQEFYRGVERRLNAGGIFLQWLQGYHVDAQVVRTAYATLSDVFPVVESWQVHAGDLLLVATREPIEHGRQRMAERLSEEPFASALELVWGVSGVEGLYSGFVANPGLARAIAELERGSLNTDDRPRIEFGFARNAGRTDGFTIGELIRLARARGEGRPAGLDGVDWSVVADRRNARTLALFALPPLPAEAVEQAWAQGAAVEGRRDRALARRAWYEGDLRGACSHWKAQPREADSALDHLLLADCLAEVGDPAFRDHAKSLARRKPAEAGFASARFRLRDGSPLLAARELERAFSVMRRDPWAHPRSVARALSLTVEVAVRAPEEAGRLFEALSQPFAASVKNEARIRARFDLARATDFDGLCRQALEAFEPHVPWNRQFLTDRHRCYAEHGDPRVWLAQGDLERYLRHAQPRLDAGLREP
jgi:predicted membrane-bound spermidine synthase